MKRSERCQSGTGFTLIELLLVLAIIALLTAVTAPSFVRSMRGNRLRAAADQVVRAGRYARSMAVIRQQEMLLNFAFDNNGIEVIPHLTAVETVDPADTEEKEEDVFLPPPDDFAEDAPEMSHGPMDISVQRALDRVIIESVDIEGEEGTFSEGTCSVIYRTNGTCVPYVIKITDEFGTTVTISVDALGGAETEREDGLE